MSADRKLHVLVKRLHPDLQGVDDEYAYDLECPGAPHCTGWQECDQTHEVDGISAANGPDEPLDTCECDGCLVCSCPSLPWDGVEEFEFHGVVHTWHIGYGWTVPYNGCVVREHDLEEHDLLLDEPPGRYLVDAEWPEPEEVYLELVGPEGGDQ